jgi:prepilin-type N-terminal cleavage/methylation domain-containing protein
MRTKPNPTSRHVQRSRSRRGLTMVELSIGLAVMGVTLVAMSSFLSAVSQSWANSQNELKASNAASVAKAQMQDVLGAMLHVVQNKQGGAEGESSHVFFWKHDALVNDDGLAQFGEMALLEYDPAVSALRLYEAKPAAEMNAAELTLAQSSEWGDPTSPDIIGFFKSSSVVGTPTTVVGRSGADESGIDVRSATLECFDPEGGKPMTNFDLTISDDGVATRSYGSVAMRGSRVPENLE